eukprot:gene16915-20117_t
MPLLGSDPYELTKTRPKAGGEYFVIRFTNEHFKKYKLFGKTDLTFEEALSSEKNAIEKVAKFSDILMPHCLKFIQYKDANLDALRDQIYDHFNNNYFPGEYVSFKADKTK